MKKQNLKKIITMGLIVTSLIAVSPIRANAEWKSDSKGYWYTEGSSYVKNDWRQINGEWYHFDYDGYMEKGWIFTDTQTVRNWYFLNDDGSMFTGTKEINGVQYRFDSTGKWTGHTDEEIESILLKVTGAKEIIKGSKAIVYDESDTTDYSKFDDGFYTKDYIDNYNLFKKEYYKLTQEELETLNSILKFDPKDIICIKNHKKVLSGIVARGGQYYIEDGHLVRNAWRKLDNTYVYYKANGCAATSQMGGNIDGFEMSNDNEGGIDRNSPYNSQKAEDRTYWISELNKYITESEYNNYVNQGKIKFQPTGEIIPTGQPDQFWLSESFEN